MRKIFVLTTLSLVSSILFFFVLSNSASALSGNDFQSGRIIDDAIFFDGSTMDTVGIQNFLNSKVPSCDTNGTQPYGGTTRAAYGTSRGYPPPYHCLRNYSQDTPTKAGEAGLCNGYGGGVKTASQIIRDVAIDCGINPKVLIILLEKEQSLVTDDWPWSIQYRSATGYGCPDTAPCDAEYYGFFNQVYNAARQFKRYSRDASMFGYRAYRDNYIQYNPNAGCGGSNVYIQNQATAGLYNYTPYQPNPSALANLYGTGDGCGAYGNRNFWRIYNDWFGSTITSRCSYEQTSLSAGVSFRKLQPFVENGNVSIYSGSGTGCVESHTWGTGFSSWRDHTSSNLPSVNPANNVIQYADLTGDGVDEPIIIGHSNTGTSMVEFHVWDITMKKWLVHAVSNLSTADSVNYAITFADINGDGRDDPVAVKYKSTSSGMVEFWAWGDGLQSWKPQNISNLTAPIDPTQMQIRYGDLNGDRVDEAIAIGLAGTGTGKIEFHVWNPGQASWQYHIVSNQAILDVNKTFVDFADFDGDRIDNGVVVGTQSTGSGKYEFHVWNPGLMSWQGHYASNQPIL